jgi:hypothetical protein
MDTFYNHALVRKDTEPQVETGGVIAMPTCGSCAWGLAREGFFICARRSTVLRNKELPTKQPIAYGCARARKGNFLVHG